MNIQDLTDRPKCYGNMTDKQLYDRLEAILRDPDNDPAVIMMAARMKGLSNEQ